MVIKESLCGVMADLILIFLRLLVGAGVQALAVENGLPGGGWRSKLGGRRDNLGGRRDNLGGRRDNLGGPRDNLDGRQDNLDGPRDELVHRDAGLRVGAIQGAVVLGV